MLAPARKLFTAKPKVKITQLLATINKILITHGHGYQKAVQPAAHRRNVFYTDGLREPEGQTYDLAFYHAAAGRKHVAHHRHDNKSSVYYMRCEEKDDQIMFGNMQIDARQPELWEDPGVGEIMLQKKNIYGMMVQQALKHAVEQGRKEILFQCGDANELTQWERRRLKTVNVTKRNYKKFEADYQQKMEKFDPKSCQVGDVFKFPQGRYGNYFVTETGPGYYRVYEDFERPPSLFLHLRNPEARGKGITPYYTEQNWNDPLDLLLKNMFQNYKSGDYGALLSEIKASIKLLTKTDLPKKHDPAQLAKLKQLLPVSAELDYYDFKGGLDLIWHELDYDQHLRACYPDIKKLIITDKGCPKSRIIFYNSCLKTKNFLYKKSKFQAPEIGKSYLTPTQDRYNINFAVCENVPLAAHRRMYNWYEKTLYQEFKKYGLGVEKIPITSIKNGREVTAHAWKIKSGISEFKKRPLALFSTRGELKMDCETLPRLQIAAAKFGCTPSQLTIVNDFLTEGQAPKRSGAYEKTTGEIYLANHSLAILAHEGLHKLKARGVIPAAEYRALVQAGKRIAQTTTKEKAYINQRDAEDNLIYPPGRARNEEYAAIFVETYYENNQAARKNLLGKKLTVTEKVFDYIKTVRDTVLARVGMPAAIARKFLRRVEGKYYQAEIQGRPASAPEKIYPALDPLNGLAREP